MRLTEAVPAIFMIVLASAILLGTSGLSYWAGTTPGTRFLPVWLAGAGLVLGVLVALARGGAGGDLELPDRSGALRVGLTLAAMAALPFATPVVGMVPAVAALMAFLLLVVLRQRLVPSLVTTVVTALGVELIFVQWLAVPLPRGALL
jgi:putative tricarboxylic transport membrane protein